MAYGFSVFWKPLGNALLGPDGTPLPSDELPLVLSAVGAQGLPRGAQVRVRLGAVDEISLDVGSTVIERLDTPAQPQAGDDEELEGGESELAAGPISIAVDVEDAQNAQDDPAAPAAGSPPKLATG